jgi:hypothetical protein
MVTFAGVGCLTHQKKKRLANFLELNGGNLFMKPLQ